MTVTAAEMQTGTLIEGTLWMADWPVSTAYSWFDYAGTETLYPANLVTAATNGLEKFTIKELILPFSDKKPVPTSGLINFTAYLAKTSLTSLESALSVTEMTEVANVTIDFSNLADPKGAKIVLDQPFVMEGGSGLIAAIQTVKIEAPSEDVFFEKTEPIGVYPEMTGKYMYGYRGNSTQDFTEASVDGKLMLSMQIGYVEGDDGGGDEPVKTVDLVANSITGPLTNVYFDKKYEYTVNLGNLGDKPADGYTLEVINVEDNTVLATVTEGARVVPGMNVDVNCDVTFTKPGTYRLAAKVSLEEDTNADNNQCEPIDVTVTTLPYKAVSVTGPSTLKAGEEGSFTFTVANQGEAALTEYNVKVLLLQANMPDVTIYEATGEEIAAGETKEYPFTYTFPLGGSYNLKGVVTVTDSEPSETPEFPIEITLDKLTPVITGTYPTLEGATTPYDSHVLERNNLNSASQLLYPASYFGDHKQPYQIQSLTFHANDEYTTIEPLPIKIYMAQTDRTTGYVNKDPSTLVPDEGFVLVYDGTWQIPNTASPQEIRFDLQNLFELENGKSLVINIIGHGKETVPAYIYMNTTDEVYRIFSYAGGPVNNDYSIYSAAKVFAYDKLLPCITFGYALAPLPAQVDVAVNKLDVRNASGDDIYAGSEVTFVVDLENKGTVDVEEYDIELLQLADETDGEPTVLKSYPFDEPLATASTASKRIKYTFAQAGTYMLAARVAVDGDVDADDNTSPVITLDVKEDPSGIDNVAAEGEMVYNAFTSTLSVNVGAGRLTVADLDGRVVATCDVEGASEIALPLGNGIYVVSLNGKKLKIQIK